MDELNETGVLKFMVGDVEVALTKDDLLIDMSQTAGYVSEADNNMTVVLDTNLTPELVEEGFVREIISKVQTMRKEAGFEVMDRITIYYADNAKIADIFARNGEMIKGEVLCDAIVADAKEGYVKEWSINGEQVTLGVKKN